MTAPVQPKVDMLLGGAWTDVTPDVRVRSGIQIRHGVAREGGISDPSEIRLTLNNRDGKYSPRNPEGPYYGLLKRGTPLRVSFEQATSWLNVGRTGSSVGSATCPDSAALSITGDLDVRIAFSGMVGACTFGKHAADFSTNTWFLERVPDDFSSSFRAGFLRLGWSTTGTSVTNTATTTKPLPYRAGPMAIRATLDVNNGAGGNTVTFYYAETLAGPWTTLEAITGSGTTSMANTTDIVRIQGRRQGQTELASSGSVAALVTGAEIYDGIAGTLRADPDFSAQAPGTTSFSDGVNTWTVNSPAEITDRHVRAMCEIVEFPPRWTVGDDDAWTEIVAAGASRRLGNSRGLQSALTRYVIQRDAQSGGNVTGYWPMEEGPGATSFLSGMGGTPLTVIGSPDFGSVQMPAAPATCSGSDSVASFEAAGAGGFPAEASDGTEFTVGFILSLPEEGTTDGAEILRWTTNGTAALWRILYESDNGGQLRVVVNNATGTELHNTAYWSNRNGGTWYFKIQAATDGSDVDFSVVSQGEGEFSATITTASVTSPAYIAIGTTAALTGAVGIGQLVTGRSSATLFDSGFDRAVLAGHGEYAGGRVKRAVEALGNVPARTETGSVLGAQLGPEQVRDIAGLAREAEAADMGILHDLQEEIGIRYVTLAALYSDLDTFDPPLELDYSAQEIVPPLSPTEDDQNLYNDVTVTSATGPSWRETDTTSPLSSEAYPDGIGVYELQKSLALYDDTQPQHAAGWLLGLGTVDEARFPAVTVDLVAQSAMLDDIQRLRVGSKLSLVNLPDWLPRGPIGLLILGWTELIGTHERTMTFNCAPSSPYNVFILDSQTNGRLETIGTTNEALDTTETGVDITGDTWITTASDAGDYPYDVVIGGEVMTVTGNSNATTGPFTVSRSENGVVKSHSTAAPIRLARPPHLAK